jgi:hypothetical protein
VAYIVLIVLEMTMPFCGGTEIAVNVAFTSHFISLILTLFLAYLGNTVESAIVLGFDLMSFFIMVFSMCASKEGQCCSCSWTNIPWLVAFAMEVIAFFTIVSQLSEGVSLRACR